MEALYSILLAVAAFFLGACPFSVWVGRWLLAKDITGYGDGNPGVTNVFRAGGRKSGLLAVILDVAKGMPFVAIAQYTLELDTPVVLAIGLCAILGHAFSPFRGFHGGKALAVFGGVIIVLPQHEVLFAFVAFILLSYLLTEPDSWIVILATTGSLVYLIATTGSSWESLFMVFVLAIFVTKQFSELKSLPRFRLKPVSWLQSRKRAT